MMLLLISLIVNMFVDVTGQQAGKLVIQIRCFPEYQYCYLGDIEKTEYPNATVTIENVAKMWKQGINSIQTDKSEKIAHRWGINGSEITNLVFLSSPMRLFLRRFNFPLFRVIRLPQNEKVLHGKGLNGRTQKRFQISQNVGISPKKCRNKQFAELRWVYTTTHCEHLYICTDAIGDEAHPNCKNRHVNGAQYLKCFCCEEDNRIEQCTGCKHV